MQRLRGFGERAAELGRAGGDAGNALAADRRHAQRTCRGNRFVSRIRAADVFGRGARLDHGEVPAIMSGVACEDLIAGADGHRGLVDSFRRALASGELGEEPSRLVVGDRFVARGLASTLGGAMKVDARALPSLDGLLSEMQARLRLVRPLANMSSFELGVDRSMLRRLAEAARHLDAVGPWQAPAPDHAGMEFDVPSVGAGNEAVLVYFEPYGRRGVRVFSSKRALHRFLADDERDSAKLLEASEPSLNVSFVLPSALPPSLRDELAEANVLPTGDYRVPRCVVLGGYARARMLLPAEADRLTRVLVELAVAYIGEARPLWLPR